MVASIVLTPFSKLQEFGLNELKSRIPDRLEFDQLSSLSNSYVAVAGAAAAFGLNMFLTGPIAFAVLCAAEVANNCFYWVAYKKYTAIEVTVTTKEVKKEDRAG